MEAHELAEKFRNTKRSRESFEEIVAWCNENADKLDLSDKDQQYLYEMSTKYILSNNKLGKMNREDANVLIHYLSKKFAKVLGIDETVSIKVLGEENANCLETSDGISQIEYSSKVVENLMSNNTETLLRGLQTIFHEVVHAKQNKVISQSLETANPTKNTWIMALEKVARKANSKFYNANYTHLFRENQAEKLGLQEALRSIQYYNPQLYQQYDPELMKGRIANYDHNFTDAQMVMNGKKFDPLIEEDTLCTLYIEEHLEYLEKYPILQLGFNSDGSKKDILQLIEDRKLMLDSGRTPEVVDELYEKIINHRNVSMGNLKGTNAELQALDDYIKQSGTDDKFIFNLIRYRLEHKTKATQEQMDKYMEQRYALAAKVRQERQEKEIIHEEPESIKDEVGDEFQPKTEAQKHEEQQVEAMWQSRFQSWDRDSINLPNGAKRKEEAVQVIQDIERDKQVQAEKKQQQTENEQR